MRKLLLIFAAFIGIPVLVLLGVIAYASVNDYKPAPMDTLAHETTPDTLPDSATFRIFIWNIGYAGLDRDMDFFYDGGKKVRTPENRLKQNLAGIVHTMARNDSADFIMLQEVDVHSKRSYRVNEVQMMTDLWGGQTYYGKNYDVFFVPLPFSNPMGQVNSGLLSHSRYKPVQVERISLPGSYAWPKRLFMLDRCLLVMHFPLHNGRELLMVNVHHEAYDNGSIRDQQMAFLKNFIKEESDKGNFLVLGGDWNQCPPNLQPQFHGEVFDTIDHKGIDPEFMAPGWQWVYDNSTPTNRRVDIPYTKGVTRTTLIDFFLVSPNLKVSSCKAIPMGFTFSDHHPVTMTFSFN